MKKIFKPEKYKGYDITIVKMNNTVILLKITKEFYSQEHLEYPNQYFKTKESALNYAKKVINQYQNKAPQNINKLNQMLDGKTESMINQKILLNGKITTYKELILSGYYIGALKRIIPKINFNRRKYNRMDYKEQLIYDKKLEETKTEYLLITIERKGSNVGKIIFDYAIRNGVKLITEEEW
jgi:hypothetical protein